VSAPVSAARAPSSYQPGRFYLQEWTVMPVQLDHQEITIFPQQQGVFEVSQKGRDYPSKILNADIVITGFRLRFTTGDRNVANVEVWTKWTANVNANPTATHVIFEVHANLRDQNPAGDQWGGFVNVLIIAVTE
jgi:hypothetical protein